MDKPHHRFRRGFSRRFNHRVTLSFIIYPERVLYNKTFYRMSKHWGLMPLHAVCSTVRPASFLYGRVLDTWPQLPCHSLHTPSIQFASLMLSNCVSLDSSVRRLKDREVESKLGDVPRVRMMVVKCLGNKSEIRRQSYYLALPSQGKHIKWMLGAVKSEW